MTLPDGRNPAVSCRAQLGRVLWLRGYPDQAVAVSESAHAIAVAQAQPLGLAFTLYFDFLLQQLRRNNATARHRAEQLMALAAEHNLPQYRIWAEILHGWAAADSGQADGIDQLQAGLAALARMNSELSRPHFLALLADALCRRGRRDAGLSVVAEGLACVDRTGERYYLAELYRIQGELLLTGEPSRDAANDSFATALRVAREQQVRGLELRAAVSLARNADAVTRDDAHATLRQIVESFTEGLDLPDMRDARELLAIG